MDQLSVLRAILSSDPLRLNAMAAVAGLALPDGWIGAGFVRDAVWDYLHGRPASPPVGDVDVVYYCRDLAGQEIDGDIEGRLRAAYPQFTWSVKNQARMHRRNGDVPYRSTADAMTHWPETATAVAARLDGEAIVIEAPLGLDDLFALRLRPTPAFAAGKQHIFRDRLASKRWMERYPKLTVLLR